MVTFKDWLGLAKKSVITVDSLDETTREGINKAYIPKFLYKPPFGYPRFANMSYVRYLATTPYVEMCIRTIIDEISSIEWDIMPADGMEEESDEAEIENIRNFFLNPNTNKESFEEVFIRMPVRDLLEINSGVLNKVYNMKEELVEIVARDGATFTKNPDIHGMFTNRDDIILPSIIVPDGADRELLNPYAEITATSARERAAYFQYGWVTGPIPVPFGKKEIIWLEAMKRTDDHYGFSPVQVMAKSLQMLIYMIESDLEYYNDNNVPKGIIGLEDSDADEIKAFKEQWFETQRTKDEFGSWKKIMNKVPIVNKTPNFTRIEFSASEMQIIEKQKWYSKLVWASFGVTPTELGFTEDAKGSANQIVQSKVFRKKAINPLLRNLEANYNMCVVSEFNYWGTTKTKKGKTIRRPKYEFKFKKFDVDEESAKYELYKLQVETGVRTINEIRKDEGLEPLDWGDDQPGAMNMDEFGNEASSDGYDDENDDGEYIDDEADDYEQDDVDDKPRKPTKSLNSKIKPTRDPSVEDEDPDKEKDPNKKEEPKKKTKSFLNKPELKYKYIKRTGSTGNYKYWYKDPKTGKLVSGKKPVKQLSEARRELIENSIRIDQEHLGKISKDTQKMIDKYDYKPKPKSEKKPPTRRELLNKEVDDMNAEELQAATEIMEAEKTSYTEKDLASAKRFLHNKPQLRKRFGKTYYEFAVEVASAIGRGEDPEEIDWNSIDSQISLHEAVMEQRVGVTAKAQTASNPLILTEGETPSGYERLESAIKYVNKQNEEELKKLLDLTMGNKTMNQVKDLNSLIAKIKGILNIQGLKSITQAIIRNNYMKGWDEAENDLNINILPDQNAIDYMSGYTYDNIKGMNDDIAEKLRGVMQRGFMDGTPLEGLKAEITKVFDVGNTRVTMIARTEANRAANFGRLHGYQKSGQPGKKVYSAHIDDRTSPLCKRLNGQEVELKDDFVDPKGEWQGPVPPAHVNCRSSWIFKSEDDNGT